MGGLPFYFCSLCLTAPQLLGYSGRLSGGGLILI